MTVTKAALVAPVVALDRFLSRDLRAFFLAAFFHAKQKDDKSNWYLRFAIFFDK